MLAWGLNNICNSTLPPTAPVVKLKLIALYKVKVNYYELKPLVRKVVHNIYRTRYLHLTWLPHRAVHLGHSV